MGRQRGHRGRERNNKERQKVTKHRPLKRHVHVYGDTPWTWQSDSWHVHIVDPDGSRKWKVEKHLFEAYRKWNDWYESYEEAITPGHVKWYIKKHILGEMLQPSLNTKYRGMVMGSHDYVLRQDGGVNSYFNGHRVGMGNLTGCEFSSRTVSR